jgi:hypothetical protein
MFGTEDKLVDCTFNKEENRYLCLKHISALPSDHLRLSGENK